VKRYFVNKNETLRRISQIDVAAAISGGDSFSDIYGLGRLIYEALPQILVLLMGKRLVLLPQTLGPFKGRFARWIAAYIMRRATVICSRDELGMKQAEQILGPSHVNKIKFCHDVGFGVPALNPSTDELLELRELRRRGERLVGFNISGLLYAGGYTRNNMFGLKVGYRDIVERVLTFLVEEIKVKVVLVPHVYDEPTIKSIESDQTACEMVFKALPARLKERVVLLRRTYSVNEVKYIIGTCDAFIGSRMHSCIAALSQGVPAVAISYSDKFDGVMRSLGMSDLIADPRRMTIAEIVEVISLTLKKEQKLRQELNTIVPKVQANIISTIREVMSECLQDETTCRPLLQSVAAAVVDCSRID
jgi:colanic acid/amylovoran biosynthesis protein